MFGIVDKCSFCIDFVFFFERKKKTLGKVYFPWVKKTIVIVMLIEIFIV